MTDQPKPTERENFDGVVVQIDIDKAAEHLREAERAALKEALDRVHEKLGMHPYAFGALLQWYKNKYC